MRVRFVLSPVWLPWTLVDRHEEPANFYGMAPQAIGIRPEVDNFGGAGSAEIPVEAHAGKIGNHPEKSSHADIWQCLLYKLFVCLTLDARGLTISSMEGTQAHLLYRLLGQRIAARRQGLLTQAQLATSIGVSRTSVTNLESGRQHPPLHQLLKIAEALDCELTDLIPSRTELSGAMSLPTFEDLRIVGELSPAAKRFVMKVTRQEEQDGSQKS